MTSLVGDLADEIVKSDPLGPRGHEITSGLGHSLTVALPGSAEAVALAADKELSESAIVSGSLVRVSDRVDGQPTLVEGRAKVHVTVLSGPTAGERTTLSGASHTIGRRTGNSIVLPDPLVSATHAKLVLGASAELVDQNSANGLMVDGSLVTRLRLISGREVTLGETTLRFEVESPSGQLERQWHIHQAEVPFMRSPRVESRYAGEEFTAPDIPNEADKPPFPWLVMLAPVVLGIGMFVVTQRVSSLAFVLMSPVMMFANYWTTRRRDKLRGDSEVSIFTSQLAELKEKLSTGVPQERAVREAEAPNAVDVCHAIEDRLPILWTRRPEHWNFLDVRLGTGREESRNAVVRPKIRKSGMVEFEAKLRDVVEEFRWIDDVPITESPIYAGAFGVVGRSDQANDVGRALMLQLLGLHSPAEMVVTALSGASGAQHFGWLKWTPHVSSAHSPLGGIHLGDTDVSNAAVLGQLEELSRTRAAVTRASGIPMLPPMESQLRSTTAGQRVGAESHDRELMLPVVVVLITSDAAVDKGRLVRLLEAAPSAGLIPIVLAGSREQLPAACRTFVDVSQGPDAAEVHYVRHGRIVAPVRAEVVPLLQAETVARSMSGVVDVGAPADDSAELPRAISLVSLLGSEMATGSVAVADRWRQNLSLRGQPRPRGKKRREPNLRAIVGKGGMDALHLDLRAQGPHALVAGTTGAGKSEFLKSWVVSMAAEFSPDRVTFLFVDYKGGTAFAECRDLPHCVGVVTDLTPKLVQRALVSLGAEVKSREKLLNDKQGVDKQIKDILELEERSDPDCPPALVIVVDEFAALAKEVPAFREGLIDIAQRGRSLGIHLIMATQRPAGVITPALRANTNLRVGLRMADPSESDDVLDSPDAARFDPSIKGRALAKLGPGPLVHFQSAYVGGWTTDAVPRPMPTVAELRFGSERLWEPPEIEEDAGQDLDRRGPNDLSRLVASIVGAAEDLGLQRPRRPWLEELRDTYDLTALLRHGPMTDKHLAFGWADLPEAQEQRLATFDPDRDGHLLIYGTGGVGKTVLLRSLAVSAALTRRGGPVHVYGLDFAGGGLQLLTGLPHVGAVIAANDTDRVVRLLRTLKAEMERRRKEYAGSDLITYREQKGRPNEPRILILLDGYPSFRNEYETGVGRATWYGVFQELLAEGRQLGVHLALTADRPASVPGAVAASAPRRIVMRLADETMYTLLGVPNDLLGDDKPGRAIVDRMETQIGIPGGKPDAQTQRQAIESLAAAMIRNGVEQAPQIRSLPTTVHLDDLINGNPGVPAFGISDENLDVVSLRPEGTFVIAGGPSSGRTNATLVLSRALKRSDPNARLICLSPRPSLLTSEGSFAECARNVEEVKQLTTRLIDDHSIDHRPGTLGVFIEALSEFYQTPAEAQIIALVKALRRTGQLVVAESETSTWQSSAPLYSELKSGRTGLLLQPEPIEGDLIYKSALPRIPRAEFPPGGGYHIQAGRAIRVQVAVA